MQNQKDQFTDGIYLQKDNLKFWHYKVNDKTFEAQIRVGDLKNNVETSSHKEQFTFKNLDDVLSNMSALIQEKNEQGYQHIDIDSIKMLPEENKLADLLPQKNYGNPPKKENDNKVEELDPFVQKSIKITDAIKANLSTIEKEAERSELFTESDGSVLQIMGNQSKFANIWELIMKLTIAHKKKVQSIQAKVQKKIRLSKRIDEKRDELVKLLKDNEVDFAIDHFGNLQMKGKANSIMVAMSWIYKQELDYASAIERSAEFYQRQINVNSFHRAEQKKIEKKAEELGLFCDFGYDIMLVSGQLGKISELQNYLNKVEADVKKELYPMYWDHSQKGKFDMYPIDQSENEFQQINNQFLKTMNGFTITSIQRIQNTKLIEPYIGMIQQWKEKYPNLEVKREFLFHGTRQNDPSVIYRDSDTGFDLLYARHGSYGKGLYFAQNANYSHNGYVYQKNGFYYLLVGDVFLGRTTNKASQDGLKANEGYDSVSANQIFIVYNNYQSYPLYLVQYTGKNNVRRY